jgi:hypothetical protein
MARGAGNEQRKDGHAVWWQDLLWGLWNGITAWIVLICHIFGFWEDQPVYDVLRQGSWYDLGFLFGAGSPFLGTVGGSKARNTRSPSPTGDRAES